MIRTPGTPERQKILSVWLSHKKNTKNASFFKSGRGHPDNTNTLYGCLGLLRASLDPKENH